MKKVIVLSRVSSASQDLSQQTDEVLREVYKDGYTDSNIIIIEDTESAIKLSEEERHGLNKMKDHINKNPKIECVYIYELSRLSRRQLVLFSIRDFLVERKIQLICLKPYFRLLEFNGEMSQTGSLRFYIKLIWRSINTNTHDIVGVVIFHPVNGYSQPPTDPPTLISIFCGELSRVIDTTYSLPA